jgi:hypothetical protein
LYMQAMELFLSSIRSPETRQSYSIYFKKYQDFTEGFMEQTFPGRILQIHLLTQELAL